MSAHSVQIKIEYNDLFESSLDFLFMIDISKEIVELHGGQILAKSKGLNKGSVFTIRLFKN